MLCRKCLLSKISLQDTFMQLQIINKLGFTYADMRDSLQSTIHMIRTSSATFPRKESPCSAFPSSVFESTQQRRASAIAEIAI